MAQNKEAILEKLKKDIELLREPNFGYIRAGLPRFPALFGRDSCIASWQLLDYEPDIARKTIDILAKFQGKEVHQLSEEEPGKILHEWHPNPKEYKLLPWPLPYYGSVDSTPLFIILAGFYFEKTQDLEWLKTYWSNIKSALSWCESFGDFDSDYLLEYERKNPLGLFHQVWKDSGLDALGIKTPVEVVEVQGYYYSALKSAANLAKRLEENEFADAQEERAKKLKEIFFQNFWLPDFEGGFFAFALEQSVAPVRRITSNPGHLLFTGILDDEAEKRDALKKRLFAEDMWTPYGIRTHSEKNPDFSPKSYHLGSIWPHDNWIIAQGLKRYGYKEEYEKIKNALLAAYKALGEIPELYAVIEGRIERIPTASSPQAWATGALLNFLLEKS